MVPKPLGRGKRVQCYSTDSKVVQRRFTLVLGIKDRSCKIQSVQYSCLHVHSSFKVSWRLHDCGTHKHEPWSLFSSRSCTINPSFTSLCATVSSDKNANLYLHHAWMLAVEVHGCIALAAEVYCYLHSPKRQDVAREAICHVRNLLYNMNVPAGKSCYRLYGWNPQKPAKQDGNNTTTLSHLYLVPLCQLCTLQNSLHALWPIYTH